MGFHTGMKTSVRYFSSRITLNIISIIFFFNFRMLQNAMETEYININCVDPLGRSALLMAIDNENLEMVELLINYSVDTKDALLHAISEEFVEAVEMLLDHEDGNQHKEGHHVCIKIYTYICEKCLYLCLANR